MAQEETGVTPELDETAEKETILEALRKERDARKAAEKQVKNIKDETDAAWQFRTQHKLDDETWNLMKDLPREKQEALAARLAATPEATPETPATEARPDEAVHAAAAALKGTPPVTDGKTYTPEEIRLMGLKDEALALRMIAEGRMKSG